MSNGSRGSSNRATSGSCSSSGSETFSSQFLYGVVHIVKSNYFTLSPGLLTVNDPKDAISVVHVNKMLAK